LVDAIAHRFEAMLQDLIEFHDYIIENFVLWNIIKDTFGICSDLRVSIRLLLKWQHLLNDGISKENLALVLIENICHQILHLLSIVVVHLYVLCFVLLRELWYLLTPQWLRFKVELGIWYVLEVCSKFHIRLTVLNSTS
jgi:hypothetical protein